MSKFRYTYTAEEKPKKTDGAPAPQNGGRRLPMVLSLTLGIVGTLIFGLGLTMVLEWNLLPAGIVVGVAGLAPIVFAYPLYEKLRKKRK